jgi:DNA (cytosine-5)-methyltransferase 1
LGGFFDTFCPEVSPALKARDAKGPSSDGDGDGAPLVCVDTMPTMQSGSDSDAAHNARSGTCKDSYIVPVSYAVRTAQTSANGIGVAVAVGVGVAHTLDQAQGQCVAFTQNQAGDVLTGDVMHSVGTNSNATGRNATGRNAINVAIPDVAQPLRGNGYNNSDPGMEAKMHIQQGMQVRRLTPEECEKLQGFEPGYTKISAKTADGPRYRALGNSMAVPCMVWLGKRIQMAEEIA